jgi:uncharacterized membrane protein YczE
MAVMRCRFGSLAFRVAVVVPAVIAMGLGVALMAQAGLGLAPWQILNQGIAQQTGMELGTANVVIGVVVLAAWLPLGQRPGIGTVANVALVGAATNVGLAIFPAPVELAPRLAEMLAGFGIIGVCSGIYLATALGPGPRDGLMTGIHRRTGWSIARTRTGIEVIVLVVGVILGGTFGIGTILYAFGVGLTVQSVLRVLDREGRVMLRPQPAMAAAGALGFEVEADADPGAIASEPT